jgi:hypothetical protein
MLARSAWASWDCVGYLVLPATPPKCEHRQHVCRLRKWLTAEGVTIAHYGEMSSGGAAMPLRKRSEGLLIREEQDEVLVLDEAAGRIHQLNPTAAFIWRMCDNTCPTGIAKALAEAYEVQEDAALEDVSRSLAELRSLGLLEVV